MILLSFEALSCAFHRFKLYSLPTSWLQEIGGREIKVNITEKPLKSVDLSFLQAEESQFVDSPHKVYVGNLAKAVTTESLKNFFSEKGKVLSAKVSRVPGTSKSTGFGFVTFSSEEDADAAISSLNNSVSCLLFVCTKLLFVFLEQFLYLVNFFRK